MKGIGVHVCGQCGAVQDTLGESFDHADSHRGYVCTRCTALDEHGCQDLACTCPCAKGDAR